MAHRDECQSTPGTCAICDAEAAGATHEEAVAQVRILEQEYLEKYGFYCHYVIDDLDIATKFNAHTHGLETDFQIVLPLPQKIAHSIISTLAERSKAGEVFVDWANLDGIIRNFPIKLVRATENNRIVWRIIFPDAQGNLEPDEISHEYFLQYVGTLP